MKKTVTISSCSGYPIYTGEHASIRAAVDHCVCDGISLAGADLAGANLAGAYLTGADLTRANLTRASLTRANLVGADLTRASLTRANLTRASLTRANLVGADLTRASLTSAATEGTRILRADGPHYAVYAYRGPDGAVRITAGCRKSFTLAQAREHWSPQNMFKWTKETPEYGEHMLRVVEFLATETALRGWGEE